MGRDGMEGARHTLRSLTLTALGLALGAAGCATTPSPYVAFAEAGSTYAATLEEVLVAAEKTGIDATSWRMLDADALSNATVESYEELSALDRERAQVLRRLREHGALLARYFGALSAIATSDVPDRAAEQAGRAYGAVETAWNGLTMIGDELRANVTFPPSQAVAEPTKVIVGKAIEGALRKELESRGDLIARELATQEALLDTIAATVSHDLAIGSAVAERMLVLDPLLEEGPVGGPEGWVTTRQRILTADETIAEVRAARTAARALRETFEALTESDK